MANANVTPAARRTYAFAHPGSSSPVTTDHDVHLPAVLALLTKLTHSEVDLLSGLGTPRLRRQLLLTMHQLIRRPKRNAATLHLVDRWFSAMPELLRLVEPGTLTYTLIQWTDSAAEAYTRN